jgi:hypothetical protein
MPTDFDATYFQKFERAALQAVAIAGTTARAELVRRIFGEGRAADGSQIGQYSTDPVYVGASSFLTKKGASQVLGSKAKRRKLYGAAKASGKPGFVPKSRPGPGGKGAIFFPEGYKGIRKADGRQTAKVDLRYTGQMQNDFQVIILPEGFNLGFLTSNNGAKMRGNESRFGKKIAEMGPDEEAFINQIYQNEANRLLG